MSKKLTGVSTIRLAVLTPWFSVRSLPARVGVYELNQLFPWSYFDGRYWNGSWGTPEAAYENRDWYATTGSEGAVLSSGLWRGLAEQPK